MSICFKHVISVISLLI